MISFKTFQSLEQLQDALLLEESYFFFKLRISFIRNWSLQTVER